jgi:hypothetical protein
MAGGHGGIIIQGPVMLKETNLVEIEFYRWVNAHPPVALPAAVAGVGLALHAHAALPGHAPAAHAALVPFLPTYYGTHAVTGHIVLENLAHGLAGARFLDVKIGARTCSQEELMAAGRGASSAWLKKQKLKIADWATSSEERGFRVVAATGFANHSRKQLAQLDPQVVYNTFLANGLPGVAAPPGAGMIPAGLRAQIAAQVEQLRVGVNWCDYAMIAASVLVVVGWDAAAGAWVARARLIDFAHSYHHTRRGGWSAEQFRKYSRNFSEGLASFSISICDYP